MNKTSYSFHRRYYNYTGGHQKFADYLGHTIAHSGSDVHLWLDNRSPIETSLFENLPSVQYQSTYSPNAANVVFLAGMDWQDYLPQMDVNKPKINLIQHVRHGDKQHPLFQFLKHKAIRICVSQAVKDAIEPYANGPCIVINMGHHIPEIDVPKNIDLYILGNKQPKMANELAQWAKTTGLNVVFHDSYVEKSAVIDAMARSNICLALPNKTEGFYLPGIEAMSLANIAIIPDCIANREYISRFSNGILCDHNIEACKAAIQRALTASPMLRIFKQWRGKRIAQSYSLVTERRRYHELLNDIPALW